MVLLSVFGSNPKNADELQLQTNAAADEGISTLPLEMYMTVTGYENGILTVVISNQSGYEMTYGEEYALQKQSESGEWEDVEAVKDYAWEDIAWVLADGEDAEASYDLAVFGTLTAGTYKLVKLDLEAEFTLG